MTQLFNDLNIILDQDSLTVFDVLPTYLDLCNSLENLKNFIKLQHEDIVKIKRAMENQENYEDQFSPTDLFVSKTAYDSAEDLYKVLNANGQFNGVSNGINVNVAKEISTGLIAIDRNAHPAIWYYNINNNDNRLNDPKVPKSSIINVHYFKDRDDDKKPQSFGYQLDVELGLAVNKEMAVLTQSGV